MNKENTKMKSENENKIEVENSNAENTDQQVPDTTEANTDGLNEELKKLSEKISALEQENTDLKEKILRKAAEFENYKRRTEKEKFEIAEFAAIPLIKKVLGVYDDVLRSLVHINDTDNLDAVKEGVNMVAAKFTKMLEEESIKRIDAKGKPFDFNFHEALLQQKAEGVEAHTVLEVVEDGYTYREKVIKHAKVIVCEE